MQWYVSHLVVWWVCTDKNIYKINLLDSSDNFISKVGLRNNKFWSEIAIFTLKDSGITWNRFESQELTHNK